MCKKTTKRDGFRNQISTTIREIIVECKKIRKEINLKDNQGTSVELLHQAV